ncbi:MAG TPA: nuclear transport factor 2 family protein [Pyrinomonadaceae bacterium]|nr:nuclear transport factor 2 family protein [Pyrinomonadaceae bacterium]
MRIPTICLLLVLTIATLFLLGCNSTSNTAATSTKEQARHEATVIRVESEIPTVEMTEYVLIAATGDERKTDAAAIMAVKVRWPLAMQSKDVKEFEAILADGFTFVGGGKVINRDEYIKDRTSPDDWRITHVKYDGLTLQYFGEIAVLSYRNRVTNTNSVTGEIEIEAINWLDVFKKENGTWKIASAHVVDFRIEPNSN